MNYDDLIIRSDEKAIFALRSLYSAYGYKPYKMRKFEEYDLYLKNKDFLVSDSLISFTDTNGKLMAMKPDVTLSIIKSTKDEAGIQKLYYDENVYRISNRTHVFEEIMQCGLECIGNVDDNCIIEVLTLAAKSLKSISEYSVLDVSDMSIITDLLDESALSFEGRKKVLSYIGERNIHELIKVCHENAVSEEKIAQLRTLVSTSGKANDVLPQIKAIAPERTAHLETIINGLVDAGFGDMVNIDFTVVNDMNYYNGIVFKGFISDIPTGVISGGQYDKLMQKMGRTASAIGFAVYLDALERMEEEQAAGDEVLNVALPKGRLGEKVYAMFEKAGFECPSIKEQNRKLIFENRECGVRYFWVKPSDVAIYVERGAADIGVAGKDILLEYEPDVYELLDLNIGKCRMAVAGPKGFVDNGDKTLRVATKFSNIARGYYSSKGRDIDIIHLNGSIEIAPILGLSDVIVDIVETGTTLKENDLEVVETVVPISARLIANKSSSKFKGEIIKKLTASLKFQMEANDD